jgi:hypothetical protein
MSYLHNVVRILGVFAIVGITDVDAALVQTGTRAGTDTAICNTSCSFYNFGPVFGGPGVSISGLSSVSDSRGEARASASLNGGFSTPVLKSQASANPTFSGAFGSAFGVQRYSYAGPGETLMLNVDLDGLVTDPEKDASETFVSLEVVLYDPQLFAFGSNRSILEDNFGVIPLVQTNLSEASVFLQLDHTNTTSDSGQISVDAATGDEFYIWAFLRSEAQSGNFATSADAFNTGTLSFVGNPNLIAASPVPLPAGVYLLSAGLLALIRARRKIG